MRIARARDWQREELPEKRTTIGLDRLFSEEEMEMIQRGVVPEQMEDKWFIYWEEGTLYFHRSWTGFCIYVVRFAPENRSWRMVGADVSRDPEEYKETSDEKDALLVSALVDVLLLRRDPALPKEGESDEQAAVLDWSMIGRALMGEHPRWMKEGEGRDREEEEGEERERERGGRGEEERGRGRER